MGKRNYALERGGPKRIHLRWRLRFRDFRVAFDEGPAWTLDRGSLFTGATLVLPDGSSLFVRRVKRPWYSIGLRDELRVERDGVPVPGSDGDPRVIGRQVGSLLFVLALLRLLVVAAAAPSTREVTFILWMLAETGLVLILGVLAWLGVRRAVVVAAGLFALETMPAIIALPAAGVIQALIAVHLIIAWRNMKPKVKVANLREIFE